MILPEVNKQIENLYLDKAMCQRVISIQMEPLNGGTRIIAWQCNMASMKTTELKLPTALQIVLDSQAFVIDVELMDNFKGSQGLPCSKSYLNRILKSRLMGVSYEENTILRDENEFHCRHIFELTAATITFYRYCRNQLHQKNSLYECTKALEEKEGIGVLDHYRVNEHEIRVEEKVSFRASDLAMKSNGKIERIKHLQLKAAGYDKDKQFFNSDEEINNIEGSAYTVISMMKLFMGPWKQIGKYFGVRRNFYFSNFMPSSLYGVMIQAIALTLFPNNYNYFQHSLAGLQRNEGKPLCVGMVLNQQEIAEHFPEFMPEDLMD